MSYRKIIAFGDSSFVISLPKEWVKRNGLKKGDTLSVEEEAGILRLGPHGVLSVPINTEFNIDYSCDVKDFKTRLFYAYVNNYSLINVKKQNIEKFAPEIRNVVANFIGMDVVEQRNDRLILSDVLDISGVSIHNYLRRVDRLILSMAEDVKVLLEGGIDRLDALSQKEEDVNKLCNLLLKVLRRGAHNKNDLRLLNLRIEEIFYYWGLVLDLEEIGDQLKRMIRLIPSKVDPALVPLFDQVMDSYNVAMKSNYLKSRELAIGVMVRRKEFFNTCDFVAEPLDKASTLLIDRIKQIHNLAGNLSGTLLKLGTTTD